MSSSGLNMFWRMCQMLEQKLRTKTLSFNNQHFIIAHSKVVNVKKV